MIEHVFLSPSLPFRSNRALVTSLHLAFMIKALHLLWANREYENVNTPPSYYTNLPITSVSHQTISIPRPKSEKTRLTTYETPIPFSPDHAPSKKAAVLE